MSGARYRGRFAPSPTGYLHVGNVRTALVAWLHARAASGTFVLRIEDVDSGRCRPRFETALLRDLKWLGLDWDEGPDKGGPYAPYRQSGRTQGYARAVERLDTFACTCTRKQLREAGGVYPGTCRQGITQPARPQALRWRVPDRTIVAHDARAPTLHAQLREQVGDVVLRRTDGDWAYALAVVVDDAAMGITDVVRGEDLWSSTPQQIALFEALGQEPPRFVHVPLVVDGQGAKLSKSRRPVDVKTLRDCGVCPQRVVAALARSLGLLKSSARVLPQELVEDFELAAICERGLDLDGLYKRV